MATSLVSLVDVLLEWTFVNDMDLSDPDDDIAYRLRLVMLAGDGDEQVDEIWHDRRLLTASTSVDVLQLEGFLEGSLGRTVTFDEVKLIFVRNVGVVGGDGGLTVTAGADILVGGAASGQWEEPFENEDDQVRVKSGGCFASVAPFTGFLIVSDDNLQIELDSGVTDDIEYDIVLAGVRA